MLMSPDSSINPSVSVTQTTTTTNNNQMFNSNQATSPNGVRVQVQECSQSQPSVAASAPFSQLAGHLRQSLVGPHRHHPYHNSVDPTSSLAAGPIFFVNKTLGNRGPLPPASAHSSHNRPSSAMLPPGNGHHQQQPTTSLIVTDANPMTSSDIKQEPQQKQQHHHQHSLSQQPHRPETPEYTKSFPVMDTTVASSVKGEPDLNIGICHTIENVSKWTRKY